MVFIKYVKYYFYYGTSSPTYPNVHPCIQRKIKLSKIFVIFTEWHLMTKTCNPIGIMFWHTELPTRRQTLLDTSLRKFLKICQQFWKILSNINLFENSSKGIPPRIPKGIRRISSKIFSSFSPVIPLTIHPWINSRIMLVIRNFFSDTSPKTNRWTTRTHSNTFGDSFSSKSSGIF